MKRAHVIGAGLAGLSASVALTQAGFTISLSDAAVQAGGRCRSYFDPQLNLLIDNGNHLMLSGNAAVHAYLETIGAMDHLTGPADADLPFVDLSTLQRWRVSPNPGPLPWWVFAPGRRVPGTASGDYLRIARLLGAEDGARVTDILPPHGPLWDRFVAPLLIAALNTPPETASAMLAAAIIRETLAKGGRACQPRIAHPNLSAALIDPALAWLEARGATIRFGRRLRAVTRNDHQVTTLNFGEGDETIGANEPVILAVPAWAATAILPEIHAPDAHHAIVNAHFHVTAPPASEPMIGVIGGTAEWIFTFPDRVSVTISAADHLCDEDRTTLAQRLWTEVAHIHAIDAPLPPWQIVRERRATFAATPEQDRKRPPAATPWRNLMLAGDWTQTHLPATIEGAIRSGRTAATLACEMRDAHVSV